ncbi:UNVERIFIED_ORG: hypothetical protein ABID33_000245 [Xanthobacter viscosus]
MDLSKMSESGLRMMHRSIRASLESDLANQNKTDPYYGVTEYPDWANWRDELEDELKQRELLFDPIVWE